MQDSIVRRLLSVTIAIEYIWNEVLGSIWFHKQPRGWCPWVMSYSTSYQPSPTAAGQIVSEIADRAGWTELKYILLSLSSSSLIDSWALLTYSNHLISSRYTRAYVFTFAFCRPFLRQDRLWPPWFRDPLLCLHSSLHAGVVLGMYSCVVKQVYSN